jgi:Fe2+ transport system protein FeoA
MLNLLFAHSNKIQAPVLALKKSTQGTRNLTQTRAGQQVTVTGFEQLAPDHQQHLEAYGLLPGRSLQVLSQRPVTIVLIEQTELAFEAEIARKVLVE